MQWSVAIIIGLYACKSPTAQVKTLPPYDRLQAEYHSYVVNFSESFFKETVNYEQELTRALSQNKFTAEQYTQLQKMQHHVRSLVAYAVYSRCFKVNRRGLDLHLRERRWQDRYDYNFYERGTKDYEYQLVINDQSLCSVFLDSLAKLIPEQVDLSQPSAEFFQQVMDGKVKSLNVNEMQVARQKFFKTALAPQIAKTTAQSMVQADYLFPFHRQDWVKDCEAYRDYYFESEAGDRTYRFAKKVREKISCTALRKLPQVVIKKHRKIDCTKSSYYSSKGKYTPFASVPVLSEEVKATIQGMNTYRVKLDELVKTRELDKIKSAQAGKDQHYTPHVEKKAWIVPFMKILNATKRTPPVLKAIDAYNCYLIEANKRGILPVIFAKVTQQATGSVHLNNRGRFFGFGKVQYKPLKLPSTQTIAQAMRELKRELIINWVAMQVVQVDTQPIAARKIYATTLNNEMAVAQLLLQNPAHVVVVTSLLREFQHAPATPKWLRTFKKFALGADLAFIPIALLGGFVTGGAGIVPILLMANAVNFLWIGGAAAEEIVARNRYRMLERALLTGNSKQIARGMQVLRVMHEKRRDLIVSGVVGGTFSLANLTLIARGLDNLATVPIDVTAAFNADVETLSMPEEETSDADLHRLR